MKNRVLLTITDTDGRPLAEFYESTEKRKPCVRFRVVGGNGEKQTSSQGYFDLSGAKRGYNDLKNRMNSAPIVF